MATKTKTKENGAGPMEVTLDTRQQIKFKNRDMIDFKKKTGKNFIKWLNDLGERMQAAGGDQRKQMAAMVEVDWEEFTAVLWIIGRRGNPEFTWDDALDADLDPAAMQQVFGMIADPTEPADTKAN